MNAQRIAGALVLLAPVARAQSIESVRASGEDFFAGASLEQAAAPDPAPTMPAAPSPDVLDRLLKTDEDIARVQTLLGQYVVGASISGPVLRRAPVDVTVGADYEAILAAFPFLQRTAVNGQIRVRLGADVASEYGRVRAEFMARLPRLILLEKLAGVDKDMSKGHLVWARALQIVSQPECVNMAGRSPWPDYCL